MGAIVDEAIAYRTVAETKDRTRARQRFAEEGADLVVFTSSSTVRNFFALKLKMPKSLQFASIGPVTTGTMAEFQVKPSIKAKQHDINGLVQAISAFYVA
jgi:uroporphyrinogen III methyltransferase/synthase